MSPIAHVQDVQADVLLIIGGSDHRIPPSQGLRYYHSLLANGAVRGIADSNANSKGENSKGENDKRTRNVELLWFEKDNHSLSLVETVDVIFECMSDWFHRLRR
jgi:acylaminoacyl-peptidase